jgi:peptidoglycan L-alanyl-D-glutamate endopeptidase CwlK
MTWLLRLFGMDDARREAAGQPPAPPPAPIAANHSEAEGLLTPRDLARLTGLHPDLVRVVRRARAIEPFTVIEGLRSRERQAALVAAGKSRTMSSRHLTGHAVDLGPIPLDWSDERAFHVLAKAMGRAAALERVPITWGGSWRGFFDGPHFELPPDRYPA